MISADIEAIIGDDFRWNFFSENENKNVFPELIEVYVKKGFLELILFSIWEYRIWIMDTENNNMYYLNAEFWSN